MIGRPAMAAELPMTPAQAVAALYDEHRDLRDLVAEAEALIAAGAPGPLAGVLGRLRAAFAAHTHNEERELRAILTGAGPSGPVDVDRMIDAHRHEHGAIDARFAVDAARDLLLVLRQHLEDEEHYLASLHP
jgi:hypothetical protein